MRKRALISLTLVMILTSCASKKTYEPVVKDYQMGEKWTWKWERTVEGEIRGQGQDTQKVVSDNGILGLWNGIDTIQIPTIADKNLGSTPFRSWPLYVGKKWKFESEWTNESGLKGKTSQDAEIISFEELNVVAGKFMAYKIRYQGLIENYSTGGKGEVTDIFWYCPQLKTNIKHVQDDGYGLYTSELISYSKTE